MNTDTWMHTRLDDVGAIGKPEMERFHGAYWVFI